MSEPTPPRNRPIAFRLRSDRSGGDVGVNVGVDSRKSVKVTILSGEEFGFTFECQHWDGLLAACRAIGPLQKIHADGRSMTELLVVAKDGGVDLRTPYRRLPQWVINLFDCDEKWASLRIPCNEGAMCIGLEKNDRSIGLTGSWRSVMLSGIRFSGVRRTALVEHIVFAVEHAKTVMETR